MFVNNPSALVDHFRKFINSNAPREGKAIINTDTTILCSNATNLVFALKEGTNLRATFPHSTFDLTSKKLIEANQSNKIIVQDLKISIQGIDYWYQMHVSPISDDENHLFLVEFRDISHFKMIELTAIKQRTRIENEMLLRTKEIVQTDLFTRDNGGFLTNFLRGLRHDLLSPVAQLKDIIDYYKKTEDPKKKEQSAQYIDESLQKLSNTAQGFSDFVDLYILPQNNEASIHIATVYKDVKELLHEEISKIKAEVTEDFSEAKTITFNEKIIASIFYNLLSNALKFRRAAEVPVIAIRTFMEGENFVLTVKDNGTGIDLEKYRHQLFMPFQRLNTDRPGIGVGLSMIKNALEKYGGDIRIESIVNEGTTVWVFIPQRAES